jgi:hypothetical protein
MMQSEDFVKLQHPAQTQALFFIAHESLVRDVVVVAAHAAHLDGTWAWQELSHCQC